MVLAGRVKIFKVSGEGKEQVLRILGPGRTFNDVPVFDGGPNPGSIATLEPSTVGHIPKGAVLSLVEKHPQVAMAVIRLLADEVPVRAPGRGQQKWGNGQQLQHRQQSDQP